MTCPNDDNLLRGILGELTVNAARELERHQRECARCRARSAEQLALLDDLRGLARPRQADSEVFVARVMDACRDAPKQAPRARRTLHLWPRLAPAAAMALAALTLVVRPAADEPARRGAWTARGHGTRVEPRLSAELSYLRGGSSYAVEGARLEPGDGLAVRVTNTRAERAYLAVLALDARGEAHWVYPAYLDPAANPASIPIEPGTRRELLPEVVEPEAVAAGSLRLFAVWSSVPVRVREVELHLDELAAPRPALSFTDAQVQQWRATWSEH